jgi:hypothetical protein
MKKLVEAADPEADADGESKAGKEVNVDAKGSDGESSFNIEDIVLNVNTTKDAINITIRIPTKAFRQ